MAARYRLLLILLFAISLFGCQDEPPEVTLPPDVIFTQAAQTVIAQLTEQAPAVTPTPVIPEATATPEPVDTPTPVDTLAPTETLPPATDTPAVAPTPAFDTILEDDFSRQDLWATIEGDDWAIGYRDNGYRVFVNIVNAAIWSIREMDITDVSLEVEAALTAGPENGYYGVVCRLQDADNFYALVISPNGMYGIVKMEDGEFEFLQEGTAEAGIINPGQALNRVRGDCLGSGLTLYANGRQLLEVQDDDLGSGTVGLVAGTRLQPGVEVLFDLFVVREP